MDIDELRTADTPTSSHLGEFLAFYRSTASSPELGQPIHDATALLGATHPDLFTGAQSRIVIETVSADTRGRTTVSYATETKHHHVSSVDADAARLLIMHAAINPGLPL